MSVSSRFWLSAGVIRLAGHKNYRHAASDDCCLLLQSALRYHHACLQVREVKTGIHSKRERIFDLVDHTPITILSARNVCHAVTVKLIVVEESNARLLYWLSEPTWEIPDLAERYMAQAAMPKLVHLIFPYGVPTCTADGESSKTDRLFCGLIGAGRSPRLTPFEGCIDVSFLRPYIAVSLATWAMI